MDVGDIYDVTSSVLEFVPTLAADKNFTVTSSDETVVTAQARTLTAVGPGEATITAVSDSNAAITAQCIVIVNYAQASGLDISMKGERVQYTGAVSEVVFTARPDGTIDPDSVFKWSVNGIEAEERGAAFSFTPDDAAGNYKITAQLGDHIAASSVRVFTREVSQVTATADGILNQQDSYTPVTVTVSYNADNGDPPPFIDFYINSELYLSDVSTLSFTPPAAGEYDISVKVNGKTVEIDGGEKLTVTAKGSVVPTALSVSYNNVWPNIIIRWNYPHTESTKYQLKIENLTTGAVDETMTSTNASAAKYFDNASFNAGDVIDLTSNSYRISVRSLGDNGLYAASQYSESITVQQINSAAVKYLQNKVMNGLLDHYIISDDEFNELYSYYLAFRKSSAKVAYTVYMGYTSSMTAAELSSAAFDYGATTGSYLNSAAGNAVKGGTINVSVTCQNSVIPTLSGGSQVYDALNALAPHVAQNSERKSNHVFAIESRAVTTTVETSEELFRAAELGANPQPKSGSTAQSLYSFAKNLLIEIISDEMTDAEKVHAIYDWIMWNVQYDYYATEIDSVARMGMYKAYYLDGVLTNRNSYAVCDGMAKALSLLCNMEGIRAHRVTGIAGGSVEGMTASAAKTYKQENWGGHAWTKVYVEGKWYVVDPTWGDVASKINNRIFEMAFHDYLLVSDEDIKYTHEYDVTTNNPDTADKSYNVYDNFEYEFVNSLGETVYVDSYIDTVGSAMNAEAALMMEYLDYQRRQASKTITINNKSVSRSYVGMEITAADSILDSFIEAASASGTKSPFRTALSALGYSSTDYRIVKFSDRVLVMLNL